MTERSEVQQLSENGVDQIDAEARAWLLRLTATIDRETAEACGSWRAADPRHEQAFRDIYRLWTALGRTEAAANGTWRNEAARLQRASIARRFMLPGSFGVAAAAIAAFILVVPHAPIAPHSPSPVTYATEVAQTQRVNLADGSRLYVGAKSAVQVSVDKLHRNVELKAGEAFFEVAKDAAHPFVVKAGDTTIRVLGTKFDVRKDGADVRVAVLEGRVEVTRRLAANHALTSTPITHVLHPGQELRLDADVPAPKLASVRAGQPGAWRDGRLNYADDSLADVVADANRYSEHPIRLSSPELAELRVTASFRTDRTDELIGNISKALGLRAEQEADGSIVLVSPVMSAP